MILEGCTLEIKQTLNGLTTDFYEVTLVSGTWPTDKKLIELCDRRSYGGHVVDNSLLNPTHKRVTVYKD